MCGNIRMYGKDISFSQVNLIELSWNRVQLMLNWNTTELHFSVLLQVQ
jgi:hypothetical protein